MISIAKIALRLQPYRKFFYLIAALLMGNIGYRLLYFSSINQFNDSVTMLNLLALVWLALLNLMLNIFTYPQQSVKVNTNLFQRFKNKLNQWLEYLLAIILLLLTVAVILLSIKMIRV
jgi:hypothetical protein